MTRTRLTSIDTIGIVSRGDIFPPQHGAAAKIYYTAVYLSHCDKEVYLITDRSPTYRQIINGVIKELPYPKWLRLYPAFHRLSPRLLNLLGVPMNDHLLFMPLFDLNLWVRTLYVTYKHSIQLLQAEFPCYTAPVLFAAFPFGIKTSLVEHNVEYARIKERTPLSRRGDFFIRFTEKFFCKTVNHLIAVSEIDKQRLFELLGVPQEITTVIPHGVDMSQYQELKGEKIRAAYGLQNSIVLIYHANFQYPPNVEAVKILNRQILPLIRAKGFSVRVLVVGLDPPYRYADKDIIFTGVVDDLPDHIAAGDIAVVPLRKGGGTRLKILEYFAARIPVVSTCKGAEGINALDGQQILLADEPEDFVDRIIDLIQNPELRRNIGEAGYQFTQQFDWRPICQQYADLYDQKEHSKV